MPKAQGALRDACQRVRRRRVPGLLALLACVQLAACANGMNLDSLAADRSLITGSIEKPATDEPAALDKAAIRQTVASWPVNAPPPDILPWVNIRTGSSGAITNIGDWREGGSLCRNFTASREAFDGVALYRGEACTGQGGRWGVVSLSDTD